MTGTNQQMTFTVPLRTERGRFVPVVEVFLYLQVLDVLTTMVGLRMGLGEASPFIRWLMDLGPFPGLMASKVIAAVLCGFCVWQRRHHIIRLINYWYAALVVWNLCLILTVLSRMRAA
ncbi:MAG: hypothetical protein HY820_33115 [Acidobacteria bacterium]|nr:hypothetical protein [Acidobacteriota bacterium]